MKKKKIIFLISLVVIILLSMVAVVEATNGEENIYETLKALITGNTNRIEVLENEVNTLESKVATLEGQVTELQSQDKEEEETEETKENSSNSSSTSSNKTSTTTKKPTSSSSNKTSTTTSNTSSSNKTSSSTTTSTTVDYQKQIDTLNKEIENLKKSIEELERKDTTQTNEIANLKTELDNKCEELEELVKSNNNSSSSSSSSKTITKAELIGTWNFEQGITAVFKNDGTVFWNKDTYKYTINENWIFIKNKDTDKEVWAMQYEYKDGRFYIIGQGATGTKTSNNTDTTELEKELENQKKIAELQYQKSVINEEISILEVELKLETQLGTEDTTELENKIKDLKTQLENINAELEKLGVQSTKPTNNSNTNTNNNSSSNSNGITIKKENNSSYTVTTNSEKEYLEGHEIAGYIEIPKTNVNIPILSKATANALNVSVAIMHGVGLNNVGNTVIMGQYYGENSDKFFSNNNKLSIGDTFYITDQTKKKITYEIYDISKVKSSDASYYERDTKGKKEITLVTYNNDTTYNRLVIFAKEK